jgi:ABC-type Fe3+-hydroxamate transport system substrate-binding protein
VAPRVHALGAAAFPGAFRERVGRVPFVHSYRFVPYSGVLVLAAVLACATPERSMPDSAGRALDAFGDTLPAGPPPRRIVSLSPAATELVFALGAGARLVGRTHWDTSPDSARLVPDMGDGMRPNTERVLAASPDLVLLYASVENRAARDAFRRAGIATLAQRIDRVADFATGVVQVGRALGDTARALVVRDSVLATIARARALTAGLARPRVLWPLWEAPLLAVGRGSYLNDLLDAAGAENIFADLAAPSPQVTFEEAVRRDPGILLIGPSRAAVLRADPRWNALRAVRDGHVVTYDTMLVGRPGVRMGEAAMHLAALLHPGLRAAR